MIARSYFDSLSEAQAAAATAEEVGSSNSVYYIGQTLVVVENGAATPYTIQPDKTLKKPGVSLDELVAFLTTTNKKMKGNDELWQI